MNYWWLPKTVYIDFSVKLSYHQSLSKDIQMEPRPKHKQQRDDSAQLPKKKFRSSAQLVNSGTLNPAKQRCDPRATSSDTTTCKKEQNKEEAG
jgi:hypothetical protein